MKKLFSLIGFLACFATSLMAAPSVSLDTLPTKLSQTATVTANRANVLPTLSSDGKWANITVGTLEDAIFEKAISNDVLKVIGLLPNSGNPASYNNRFFCENNQTQYLNGFVNNVGLVIRFAQPIDISGKADKSQIKPVVAGDGVAVDSSMGKYIVSVPTLNALTTQMFQKASSVALRDSLAKLRQDSALHAYNINDVNLKTAAETARATAAEKNIGKASVNYYYVNKRTDITATQQDAAAVKGNTYLTFRNVYLARNSAITDLRNGTITSAVIYVYYGNKVKIAEDTCTKTDIDYRIPVGANANKYYANYDSDTTSTRTSNLAFANLFYIFEDNTKIDNYTSSTSRLCSDNVGSVNGITNFGFQNLDYESYYGQAYDGGEAKVSDEVEINNKSQNVILRFKNFICRRAVSFLKGDGNPIFEVSGKCWTKTNQPSLTNVLDSIYAIKTFTVNDYRIGGDFNADTTFSVNDGWAGSRYYNFKNATVNYNVNSVKYADGSTNFIGVYALYGSMIQNSVLNFNIKSFEQRYQRVFNHLNNVGQTANNSILGFGGDQTKNKYAVNFNFGYIKSEQPFIKQFWGGSTDSVTYSINANIANFDCTYGGATTLSTYSVVNLSMINLASTMTITGNYTCKGYASMFNISAGTGTIILNGTFKTLDDKPVIIVSSAFTGKLIVNGQLIVGRDITNPTSASISGSGTAIIQSVISNKAATTTTIGNAISVNTVFK
jgi:hypothetical protein